MAQIFRPRANTIARFVLVSIVAVPVILLGAHTLLMNSPYLTGEGRTPQQPVPFSHKHHVLEIGLDCRYCHFSVEESPTAGVPPTRICMSCHSLLWTHAPMLAPVRASYQTGEALHWQQVNRLPGYVYFDHSIHVAKGVGCTTCHGPIEKMPLTYQAQPLTMGWCLDCHRNPGPALREPSEIFLTDWLPSENPTEIRKLIAHYMIRTTHLTDCSTCHR